MPEEEPDRKKELEYLEVDLENIRTRIILLYDPETYMRNIALDALRRVLDALREDLNDDGQES